MFLTLSSRKQADADLSVYPDYLDSLSGTWPYASSWIDSLVLTNVRYLSWIDPRFSKYFPMKTLAASAIPGKIAAPSNLRTQLTSSHRLHRMISRRLEDDCYKKLSAEHCLSRW